MTPVKFNRYNPGAADKIVIVERILYWEQIDYNGNYGTKIYLDTGLEIHVGEWPTEVENKIKTALASRGDQ